MDKLLEIENLTVCAEEKTLLNGVDLTIAPGSRHALMGPNGSGKSSLALAVMGAPHLTISGGSLRFKGVDLLSLPTEERARAGLFLSFQTPPEIAGLNSLNFFKHAMAARAAAQAHEALAAPEFFRLVRENTAKLGMDEDKIRRNFNVGFSGGERKKMEILQMLLLKPDLIILDEPDSGLDVDALKVVADALLDYLQENPKAGLLLITHHPRFLNLLKPEHVHLLLQGKIARRGGMEIVRSIEEKGYGDK